MGDCPFIVHARSCQKLENGKYRFRQRLHTSFTTRTHFPRTSTVTGPGVEVPGDPPSHGRDSATVSGHAILAVLYGNQYTVLYDTEPTEIDGLE